MSPSTTTVCRPSGYGAYWLFVPYSRGLRYRPVKPSSDQLRGAHVAQPLLIEISCVTEVWYQAHPIHLHHLVGKALNSFHRKKQYIWPLPHPLPHLYLSGIAGHIWLLAFTPKYSTCISNDFIFCLIFLKFSHKFLYTCSFILSIKKNNWKISRFWVANPLNC